ncbi:hypothetical protein Tco_0104608 [Tanacetum coccineum]
MWSRQELLRFSQHATMDPPGDIMVQNLQANKIFCLRFSSGHHPIIDAHGFVRTVTRANVKEKLNRRDENLKTPSKL